MEKEDVVRQPSSLTADLLLRDRAAHTPSLCFEFRDGTFHGTVAFTHSAAVPDPVEGEN